jgi:NADH-quinone oxidoreductase subunit A
MHPISGADLFSPWHPSLLALVLYTGMVFGLALGLLFLCGWLGQRRFSHEKMRPYESGIIPTGAARLRYPVPFFRVAIFFLIFDVEGAFIFSWAIAANALGWAGWLEMAFFIIVLMGGLFYLWAKGGLAWGPHLSKK